ncbi:Rootletin isoform X5 [Aix galericulata]|nr:Rootletin isoform X5 [Aix galericulata]
MSTPKSEAAIEEENRILQQELSRLEDLLAQSRAERDELAIKYNAISERLEQSLRLEAGEQDAAESRSLAQHNIELRRLLDEEQAAYKRKLQAYQEGQQRQAQLVQKLQAKVLQYKKKCGEVEQQLLEKATELEQERLTSQLDISGSQLEEESSNELENALIRLEEEQQRSSSLVQVNSMLREQLEQANSFNAYFSNEHGRLLTLWRQAVAFRRHFGQLRAATERDLAELSQEVSRAGRAAHAACVQLGAHLRLAEGRAGAAREQQAQQLAQLEEQLAARARDAELEKTALGDRLAELTAALERLREEGGEKERAVAALTLQLQKMEASRAQEPSAEEVQALRAEVELLHQTLQDVTQVPPALPCTPTAATTSVPQFPLPWWTTAERCPRPSQAVLADDPGSPTEPPRLPCRSLSPAAAAATLGAVHGALRRRHFQLQEAREASGSLRRELGDSESRRAALEQRLEQLSAEAGGCRRAQDEALREATRLRADIELLRSERGRVEQALAAEQARAGVLQRSEAELQRRGRGLEEQRDEAARAAEAARQQLEHSQQQLEQLEGQRAAVQQELLQAREALSRAQLEAEVARGERAALDEALAQAQGSSAELEAALQEARAEAAQLREALARGSELSASLARDKRELSRTLAGLEEEREAAGEATRALEGLRARLGQLERGRRDVEAERLGLERARRAAAKGNWE